VHVNVIALIVVDMSTSLLYIRYVPVAVGEYTICVVNLPSPSIVKPNVYPAVEV